MKWKIDDENSGKVSDIPQWIKDKYNHDQWPLLTSNGQQMVDVYDGVELKAFHIWPSHPEIIDKAEEITSGKSTVFEKVEAIYDYLDYEFSFSNSGGAPQSCITTYRNRMGNSDDQSILLISMCRAIGIPAWLEGGAMYDANVASASGDPTQGWGGHAWARVLIPVKDGDSGFSYEEAVVDTINDQFLYRDDAKLTDWIDMWGDDEHILDYYTSLRYVYTMEDGFHAPTVEDQYYLTDYKLK